jgi:hypothetical protein
MHQHVANEPKVCPLQHLGQQCWIRVRPDEQSLKFVFPVYPADQFCSVWQVQSGAENKQVLQLARGL